MFFKQAKKKDYLAKTLLATLPALELRPHKKIPQKHPTITRTTTWDFDADDLDNDRSEQTEDGSDHANEDKDVGNDQSDNGELKPSENEDKSTKKHISFGDVVVRNPPQPHMSPNAAAHSPPLGSSPKASADIAIPTAVSGAKKSRFIIQETITPRDGYDPFTGAPNTNSPHPLSSPSVDPISRDDDPNSLLLGLGMTSSMTPPPSSTPQDVPVRKGRFSVNSTPRHSISGDSSYFATSNESLSIRDSPLNRINSQENIGMAYQAAFSQFDPNQTDLPCLKIVNPGLKLCITNYQGHQICHLYQTPQATLAMNPIRYLEKDLCHRLAHHYSESLPPMPEPAAFLSLKRIVMARMVIVKIVETLVKTVVEIGVESVTMVLSVAMSKCHHTSTRFLLNLEKSVDLN